LIHWKWIKGHQDNNASYEDLGNWAKANNVLVNNIAKAYWNHFVAARAEPTTNQFGDEAWALYVKGEKVGKFDKHKLYYSICKEKNYGILGK
jgi:hypothetical protein